MSLRRSFVAVALAFFASACSDDTPSRPVAIDAALEAAAPDVGPAPFDASFEVGVVDAGSGPPSGPRDRAGRALVARLLVSSANLDTYAQLPHPFETKYDNGAPDAATSIGEDIETRLAQLDALDGKIDWPIPGGGSHELLDVMLNDGLVVDPDLPFSPGGYLDFEANGAARTTCGGRYPGDDAIDKTLSFLVGRARTGVSDGVGTSDVAPTLTFPYLAPPQ
jgi:hypothetical protein